MSATNPAAGGIPISLHARSPFAYIPHAVDPLDKIATSTVAMIFFFGSLTFATVGMACRALLLGDKRAILAAINVKIKAPIPERNNFYYMNSHSDPSSGDAVASRSIGSCDFNAALSHSNRSKSVVSEGNSSLWADEENDAGSNRNGSIRSGTLSKAGRSVGSRSSALSQSQDPNATNFTNSESFPHPWEPTFVSTFVLFYHFTIFGIILFTIYLLEKHPPNGGSGAFSVGLMRGARGMAKEIGVSNFDEDQFLFWIIVVLVYGYSVSWRRNDGKPDDFNSHPSRRLTERIGDDPTVTSHSTKSGARSRRSGLGGVTVKSTNSRPRCDEASQDGDSSQCSDVSKCLEDVLLDEEESKQGVDTAEDTTEDEYDGEEVCCKIKTDQYCADLMGGSKMEVVADLKPEEDILNRFQTLEWRGFLSIALLIYKYNHAGIVRGSSSYSGFYKDMLDDENESEIIETNIYDSLYNTAMASMVFMTGYNQTANLYFAKRTRYGGPPANYRISRVIDIICRMNLTALFLCLILGNPLDLYVACPLHTYFFFLIWMAMRLQYEANYSKYLFRLKLFGFACFIFLFWDCDFGLRETLHSFLGHSSGSVGGLIGFVRELDYISFLHHWAAFIGAVYAINQPILSLQLRKLESLGKIPRFLAKGFMLGALGLGASCWVDGPHQQAIAYFGVVPFLFYIYLRNMLDTLRERHIGVFSWIGKYSLEIYLLQNHTLANGRHLVLIRGFPRCNFIAVVVVIVLVARILYQSTTIIRQILFPNDGIRCVQQFTALTLGIMGLYVLAMVLIWADMITVGTLSTVTVVSGILLYQTVIDITGEDFSTSERPKRLQSSKGSAGSIDEKLRPESSAAKLSPPIIGTLSVFIVGLTWHTWAVSSGTSPNSPLGMACGAFVNDGIWIPVQVCSAFEKARIQIEYKSTSFYAPAECGELSESNQWAWPKTSSGCSFRYRSDIEVQRKLEGRRVMFIGDTSVRSLFFSICRFMGDLDAGGIDSSLQSHSDSLRKFGTTTIEFKWAPLSIDVVTKIKNLKSTTAMLHGSKTPPDLVLVGAGVFDKLHLALTDEDSQSERDVVTRLTAELRSLHQMDIPTVWFSPPTVNTRALNSDEKRSQMNEESIEDMRRVYAELGVESSVTFVLDGPSFTHERVADSFDGVHYPDDVYDAGSQILFNALDWLIDGPDNSFASSYNEMPRITGNPFLGMMMLCFAIIGLFFFDGYFGISYLAQIFVGGNNVAPSELYHDALDPIFTRLKLNQSAKDWKIESQDDDNELRSLLGRSSTSSSLSRRR